MAYSFYWDKLFYEVKQMLGYFVLQDEEDFERVSSIIESGYRQFIYPPVIALTAGQTHVWSFLRPDVTQTIGATESATEDLPSDFASLSGNIVFADQSFNAIQRITVERMRNLVPIQVESGVPRYYTVIANADATYALKFWPKPDKEYSIVYRYERKPALRPEEKATGEGVIAVGEETASLSDSGAFSNIVAGDRVRIEGHAVSIGVLVLKVEGKEGNDVLTLEYDEDLIPGEAVKYHVYEDPEMLGGEEHIDTIEASVMSVAENRLGNPQGGHRAQYLNQLLPSSIIRDKSLSAPVKLGREFEGGKIPLVRDDYTITWNGTEI